MTGNEAINIVLGRVRDPMATAHSREFVLSQLSDCQRLVNIYTKAVTKDAVFNVERFHMLYAPLSEIILDHGRICHVHSNEDKTEVPPCDWLQLSYSQPNWSREVGGQLEHWAYIGRDMLLLYPALRHDSVVNITYAALLPDIGSEDSVLVMPDQYVPMVLDLCEVHLLTKQRTGDTTWATAASKTQVSTGVTMQTQMPAPRRRAVMADAEQYE